MVWNATTKIKLADLWNCSIRCENRNLKKNNVNLPDILDQCDYIHRSRIIILVSKPLKNKKNIFNSIEVALSNTFYEQSLHHIEKKNSFWIDYWGFNLISHASLVSYWTCKLSYSFYSFIICDKHFCRCASNEQQQQKNQLCFKLVAKNVLTAIAEAIFCSCNNQKMHAEDGHFQPQSGILMIGWPWIIIINVLN